MSEEPAVCADDQTPTEREAWYDKEIAPALLALCERCREQGMAFIAVVEHEAGRRGQTYSLPSNAGLEMIMLAHCAKVGQNLDSYVIGFIRHCRKHGIDMSASMVAARMTAP